MPTAVHTRQHWLTCLCTLSAFVCALAWSSGAWAAVPMCGEHAQTIAAPPIGTPASSAALSVSNPCDVSLLFGVSGTPDRDAPQKLTLPELPLRALPIFPRLPICPVSGRIAASAAQRLPTPLAFARAIERPPRGERARR